MGNKGTGCQGQEVGGKNGREGIDGILQVLSKISGPENFKAQGQKT